MINFENIFSIEHKETKPQNYYVYVRLYKSVYKSKLNPASLIDKGIQIIDQKTDTSNGNQVGYFNHATMNTSLNDDFLGLTLAPGDIPDLRTETIGTKQSDNNYINGCDHDRSQYSVYALECTATDYKNVCNMLNRQTSYDITDYSAPQNAIIGVTKIASNIAGLLKRKKIEHSTQSLIGSTEDFNDIDKITGAVCSTFVMNVLYNCVNKIHKSIDKQHMNINLFTPNDIINKIPDMEFCFGGVFSSYKRDCKNFITSHPDHGELL